MKYTETQHQQFILDLDVVIQDVRELLIRKNLAYGDSALNPVRVFSKVSIYEQLLVRIDDKLSRLVHGEAAGEDVYKDLVGYLILFHIAKLRDNRISHG